MKHVHLADLDHRYDPTDPEGFRAGMARFGFGAEDSGATLYELPPGQAVCPYHYEYGEEEWALVIAGRPSVRTPEGIRELQPLDLVFFAKGPEGAHQVRNDADEPARVLMWSTSVLPTATAYPDSDKVGLWTGVEGHDVMARRSASLPYYDGEVFPDAQP